MHWPGSRLNRKFAIGTAAGLLASSLVFLVLFLALYRTELADERAAAAAQVTRLLQTSLENAMLKRDLEGLRTIVERLGRQPGIAAVFITNPGGEVRFASDPVRLGEQQPSDPDNRSTQTEFVHDASGRELLRSITPVPNRPACLECHGPASLHPVNGILFVDYDAAPIRRKAQTTTLILMGSGAVIVLLNLVGGWWFMQRYVVVPVRRLTTASRGLALGDLTQRADLRGDDELVDLAGSFNRMADQLQERIAEAEHQRGFLQALVDAIPDGVRVITPDYRVVLTNVAYRRQLDLGGSDGVGELCYAICHGADHPCPSNLVTCPLHEIQRDGSPVMALHRHLDSNGVAMDVEIYAAPMRATHRGQTQTMVVESIRDLSKQVKYSHEQKLSELGKLATGVAHEIYNPLTSVRLALDSLRHGDATLEPQIAEYLELVDREIDKCVAFTERLLRLGMPPTEAPELITIADIVRDTLGLVGWEARQFDIKLSTDLTPGIRVLATDNEMRIVLLNLVQNTFHAMPRGGTLRVTTRSTPDGVEVSVHDNGIGIEADRLARIFDPFYSRRADGTRGTGIGLSVVRTIVEHYGGRIDVDSEPGRGSVFSITLPNATTDKGAA